MATAISFNPFPKGHAGGIILHNGTLGGDPWIGVMMPPVKETEILLHVEGLPSRCVFDTKGDRILFSQHQGQYRLHIMSKDSAGSNVLSPFLFANVWEDSKICWGAKNLAPTTFNSAWEFYWTAPFNNHLVPRPKVDVSFSEWMKRPENVGLKVENPRLRKICERLLSKIGGEANRLRSVTGPDIGKWPANPRAAALRVRLARLGSYYERLTHTITEIKRRQTEECAVRGKKWVAINHPSYMKALHMRTEIASKIAIAQQDVEELVTTQRVRDVISSYSRDIIYFTRQAAFYPNVEHNAVKRGLIRHTTSRETHDWRNGITDNNRTVMRNTLARIKLSFNVSWKEILLFLRALILWEMEVMLKESENFSLEDKYRVWCEEQNGSHYQRHFFEDGWRKCLEFKRVNDWMGAWTQRGAFSQDCEGVALIPSKIFVGHPEYPKMGQLPFDIGDVCVPYNDGEYIGRVRERLCLYKNITDKVKYLFLPGTTFSALTNGNELIEQKDDTFEQDVEMLESVNPPTDRNHICNLFTKVGYPVSVWRYEARRRRA